MYEDALLEMQNNALTRQNKSLLEMQPFMLESLGLRRNSATGQLERIPDTSQQDPFLNRFKLDQKARLLGNYTSPQMEQGILSWKNRFNLNDPQAKTEFEKNAAILNEGINRGALESGANLISQREGLLSNLKARQAGELSNINAPDMKMITGIQAALQPYQSIKERNFMRQQQSDYNRRSEQQSKAQLMSTAFGLAGAVAGNFLFPGVGGMIGGGLTGGLLGGLLGDLF